MKNFMARKMNALKVSQAVRGLAEVTNRQPIPQTVAYLLQPHLQALKISPPRQRMQIAVETVAHTDDPDMVKIIHTV